MLISEQQAFFAEDLGDSQVKTADAATGVSFPDLPQGRYLAQFRNVAGGAATVWCAQGDADLSPPNAVPATPFSVDGEPAGKLFSTTVRGVSVSVAEQARKARNKLTFRTDVGTVDIVLTKISRQ